MWPLSYMPLIDDTDSTDLGVKGTKIELREVS